MKHECETCKYTPECSEIDYCITDCGENYVINTLLEKEGYRNVNIDWIFTDDLTLEGIELYTPDAKKLMENLSILGYSSTLHHKPLQKSYLSTVVIDGYRPIELCPIFPLMGGMQ